MEAECVIRPFPFKAADHRRQAIERFSIEPKDLAYLSRC
jgi:hypothetical protein